MIYLHVYYYFCRRHCCYSYHHERNKCFWNVTFIAFFIHFSWHHPHDTWSKLHTPICGAICFYFHVDYSKLFNSFLSLAVVVWLFLLLLLLLLYFISNDLFPWEIYHLFPTSRFNSDYVQKNGGSSQCEVHIYNNQIYIIITWQISPIPEIRMHA